MRTPQEIVNRIERLLPDDLLGFDTQDLLLALDFEHAKPYLKPGTTKAQWDEGRPPYSPETSRDQIRNYLDFAWEKANGERGISSSRSISHFISWIWLAGDDDVLARVEAAEYAPYGKPKLKIIEEHYRPSIYFAG